MALDPWTRASISQRRAAVTSRVKEESVVEDSETKARHHPTVH